MELWNRIRGTVRVEITAADPETVLADAIDRGLTLYEITAVSGVTQSFAISGAQLGILEGLIQKHQGKLQVLGKWGMVYRIAAWWKRPVLLVILTVLFVASLILPGRIFMIRVQGNETVPTRLILEMADQAGLSFGTSRRGVRSERIKNELLGAIDALEWAGVNTSGSVATIDVRERKEELKQQESAPCDLVAAQDGVIEQVTVLHGEAKCAPGQAVRKGDMLISGRLDLGICTRVVAAEGEVYARTLREKTAVLPREGEKRGESHGVITRYSILIGKKRINLYSDSGILMPTCGKMTKTNQIHLPGGFVFPAALIEETYNVYREVPDSPDASAAERMLMQTLARQLQQDIVAGSVVQAEYRWVSSDLVWCLTASYECREMIARQDKGVYLQDYG